jgi:hypothetical protein
VSHWHSAKSPSTSFGAVTATFLYRVTGDSRQSLCRLPDKEYSTKKPLPIYSSRDFFAKCHTWQKLRRVFPDECFIHSGKAVVSDGSGSVVLPSRRVLLLYYTIVVRWPHMQRKLGDTISQGRCRCMLLVAFPDMYKQY